MKVEQLYTGCLAEAAYYIESNGEAAIIDPLRETAPYIERLQADGATLKYVFETHFHADFVSGHLDLAKQTGATIVYGPTAQPNFEACVAKDEEDFQVGDVKIRVLHTPGHTMESSTFLLFDESGQPHAIFTGDTLFLGDVGRPDLAVKTDLSQEDLARHLYHSLQDKILPLPDSVIVYPGHGQGSACGKKMSSETVDTLGHQRATNYALDPALTEAGFIEAVLDGLVAPPQYFPKNAVMNKSGYESIDTVLDRGLAALDVDHFKAMMEEPDTLVIDTRSPAEFAEGHIPGSWFIGIDDNFAPWVGALVTDLKKPILFVADPGREEEVVTRLARVGYDNSVGYLNGGLQAWRAANQPVASIDQISAEDLAQLPTSEINLLDVRRTSEYESEHVIGAQNFPLDTLLSQIDDLATTGKYYLHCAGGYRSMIATSILKAHGFNHLINVMGGFKAISETSLPTSEYLEPSTML